MSDHSCDHDPVGQPAQGCIGIPRQGEFNPVAFEQAITDLLHACGVNPNSDHTGKTPQRVRELWQKRLLGGYSIDPAEALGDGFADARQDMVVVGRIARLVDAIGHRFTYQEWMTRDIAEALMTHGKALGAACIIEAEQLCLLLGEDRRGDERVVTQAFTGVFHSSDQTRNEFLRAVRG
jgi:GTP cyclohydrolase I